MRKLLMALTVLFVMAGLVVAAEVTLVSYDKEKKTLVVKDGDAEKTYKVTDKTKFTKTDGKGENGKEAKIEDFEKASEKGKGKAKLTVTTDKDTVTEITWKAGGKKDKN